MSTRTRILVWKTGEPIEPVRRRRGSFARLFEEGLAPAGIGPSVEVVEHDATAHGASDPLPPLSSIDGIVITGSVAYVEERAPWMRRSARLVEEALDRRVPLLGVCFGHQLLGAALGADVGENPRGREMGTSEVELLDAGDALLAPLPRRFAAQVTHRDVIRDPGPRLEVLGRAPHDACHVVRAGPLAWGVQFHPEFDEDVMGAYLLARRSLLDEALGEGATDRRLASLRGTPEAAGVLASFSRVCAARTGERSAGEVARGA